MRQSAQRRSHNLGLLAPRTIGLWSQYVAMYVCIDKTMVRVCVVRQAWACMPPPPLHRACAVSLGYAQLRMREPAGSARTRFVTEQLGPREECRRRDVHCMKGTTTHTVVVFAYCIQRKRGMPS